MKIFLLILVIACGNLGSLLAAEKPALKNRVIATISVGSQASGIVAGPAGEYVYIGNGSNISAIDVATNTVSFTLPTNATFAGATTLAISPNRKTLYWASGANVLDKISISKRKVTTSFATGNLPDTLAVSPNGTLIYVPNFLDGTVTVISNQKLLNPISVGGNPAEVVFNPNGQEAYLVGGSYVSVINTSNNTVSTTIALPTLATGVAITADGKSLFVAANDAVYQINIANQTITRTIPVTNPNGTNLLAYPALTPNGKYLYVPVAGQESNNTLIEGNYAVVINTATGKLVGQPISVGHVPIMAAITPNGKYVYISNEYDGTVSVIEVF
jgi:YVTN family beta-propeller protein